MLGAVRRVQTQSIGLYTLRRLLPDGLVNAAAWCCRRAVSQSGSCRCVCVCVAGVGGCALASDDDYVARARALYEHCNLCALFAMPTQKGKHTFASDSFRDSTRPIAFAPAGQSSPNRRRRPQRLCAAVFALTCGARDAPRRCARALSASYFCRIGTI